MLSLFLVDDHVLFRRGLLSLLESFPEFRVVGEAGDAESALPLILQTNPQLLLLDIHLPGMSGLALLRQLRQRGFQGKILFLTVSEDDEEVLTAVREGADGYLLKNVEPQTFYRLLLQVASGHAVLSPEVTAKVFEPLRRPASPAITPLSKRELQVLRAMAEGQTTAEIARRLFLSENTVKTHVRHILDKLGVKNRAEAVARAVEWGWLQDKV